MNKRKKFFNDLKKLNPGNLHMKEIILAYERMKPCCRIIVHDSKLKKLKEFCEKYKLFLEKSSSKSVWIKDIVKRGFHTRPTRVSPTHKKGFWYCYISKTKKHAKKAKNAEKFRNGEEFGKILGYPKCCRNLFHYADRKGFSLKTGNFVLLSLKETKEEPPYNFYNNFASLYFAFSLLSHFPCSFNCKRSAKLAEKYFKTLQKYSKKWAEKFIKYQKSAILFTEHDGVFLIREFEFKNKILTYDKSKIKSTLKNKIFDNLKEGNNIKIVNKNHVIIRKDNKVIKELNRKNIGMCIFK